MNATQILPLESKNNNKHVKLLTKVSHDKGKIWVTFTDFMYLRIWFCA